MAVGHTRDEELRVRETLKAEGVWWVRFEDPTAWSWGWRSFTL